MAEVLDRKRVNQCKTVSKQSSMYKVIMHNDNVTPMQVVVMILVLVFDKTQQEAMQLMLSIHNSTSGVVGVYSRDEAYKKVDEADEIKRKFNAPLVITIEKE